MILQPPPCGGARRPVRGLHRYFKVTKRYCWARCTLHSSFPGKFRNRPFLTPSRPRRRFSVSASGSGLIRTAADVPVLLGGSSAGAQKRHTWQPETRQEAGRTLHDLFVWQRCRALPRIRLAVPFQQVVQPLWLAFSCMVGYVSKSESDNIIIHPISDL